MTSFRVTPAELDQGATRIDHLRPAHTTSPPRSRVRARRALFFLFWVWFIAMPMWAIFMLITAGICFAVSRSRPPALSFGIDVS